MLMCLPSRFDVCKRSITTVCCLGVGCGISLHDHISANNLLMWLLGEHGTSKRLPKHESAKTATKIQQTQTDHHEPLIQSSQMLCGSSPEVVACLACASLVQQQRPRVGSCSGKRVREQIDRRCLSCREVLQL